MCRGFVCFHDNKWRAVPESSLMAEWKRGQKIESGGLQRIIAVERRWLLPASVDREQGGQLPISPCAQPSSPVVSCDYTVTSIRPQRRGRRVAGSGVCRGWRGFDLSLTKTLHIKNTCSQFMTVYIHISAATTINWQLLLHTDGFWWELRSYKGRLRLKSNVWTDDLSLQNPTRAGSFTDGCKVDSDCCFQVSYIIKTTTFHICWET